MISARLTVRRLSQLGEGVALFWGRSVFIEGGLPGEKIRGRFDPRARVLRVEDPELVERSSSRRVSFCPHSDRCGGCDWIHLDDSAQREAKQEIVLSTLEHLAGIERSRLEVRPFIASPRSTGYRARAVFHVAEEGLGFFGRRSHERIRVSACPALIEAAQSMPERVAAALTPMLGDIEAVELIATERRAAIGINLKAAIKPRHPEIVERALRAAELSGAVLRPNEGPVMLIGKPTLSIEAPGAAGVRLYLRPDAFFQANAEGNGLLVRAALDATPTNAKAPRVLELYCGNGNFTFGLAARSHQVVAVESASVGLEMARKAASDARVSNMRFIQGDAEKIADGLAKEGERFDVLFVDPPRAGAKGIGVWAERLGVRHVTYVACDPSSLARDARELESRGFVARTVQVVDMFPQTRHVEAVMAFAR